MALGRGRRLPQPPADYPPTNGQNGNTNGYYNNAHIHKGLPPEPRYTNGNQVADIPSISMPMPDLNGNDWSTPRNSQGSVNGVSRHPSDRATPSGTPLQYENNYEEPPPRSPSSLDDMYASPSEYLPPSGFRSPEQALAARPTPPTASSSSLYPGSLCSLPNTSNCLIINKLLPDSQAQVGRSSSNASGMSSSHPGVARNTSTTTAATTSTTRSSLFADNDTLHFRPTSSAATTLDRGNSVGSYASRAESGEWAPLPPAKYEMSTPQQSYIQPQPGPSQFAAGPSGGRSWQEREKDIFQQLQDIKRPLQVHEGYDDEFYDDEDPSEDGDRFFNPALLSHIAVRLRDKVPRGTHVKGSIPYERAFTGKDIVVRIFLRYTAIPIISVGLHSLPSNPRFSENFSSRIILELTTDEPLCKSRAACSHSYSFMKSSGVVEFFRMVSRTCTCSWTIRKAHRMRVLNRRSCLQGS